MISIYQLNCHHIKNKSIMMNTAELWPYVHRYVKKEDRKIVLLFFQSEMGSSGMVEHNQVLNQNLMVNKMVFFK